MVNCALQHQCFPDVLCISVSIHHALKCSMHCGHHGFQQMLWNSWYCCSSQPSKHGIPIDPCPIIPTDKGIFTSFSLKSLYILITPASLKVRCLPTTDGTQLYALLMKPLLCKYFIHNLLHHAIADHLSELSNWSSFIKFDTQCVLS